MVQITYLKKRHRCREQIFGYQGGQGGNGMKWEIGIDIYPLYINGFQSFKKIFMPVFRNAFTVPNSI